MRNVAVDELFVAAPLIARGSGSMSSLDHGTHLVLLLVQLLQHLPSSDVHAGTSLAQDGGVGLNHLLDGLVRLLILRHHLRTVRALDAGVGCQL